MSERLTREQIANILDRLVTAIIRGDEGQLLLESELIDSFASLMDEVERLRIVVEFLAKPRGRMAAHVHCDTAIQMAREALGVEK